MNKLPGFSRTCIRRTVSFRQLFNRPSIQSGTQHQSRFISSSSTRCSDQVQDELSHVAPLPPAEPISLQSTKPTNSAQHQHSQRQQQKSSTSPKLLTGTITRTGTMQSCIQITHMSQEYDTHLKKHYTRPHRLLIHDPNPSGYLRTGDVIEYSSWTPEEKQARLQRKQTFEQAALHHQQQQTATSPTTKKPAARQGRRFMTAKKRTGNHGTGQEKWVGPRYVVRRVVTPFGIDLDQRMEEIVREAQSTNNNPDAPVQGEKVRLKGKHGNVSQKVASAKIAG